MEASEPPGGLEGEWWQETDVVGVGRLGTVDTHPSLPGLLGPTGEVPSFLLPRCLCARWREPWRAEGIWSRDITHVGGLVSCL